MNSLVSPDIALRQADITWVLKQLFFLSLLLTVNIAGVYAEDTLIHSNPVPQTANYVRLLKDKKSSEPVALQTSIEHLTGKDSRGVFKIDLVSAVHIAESSYYQALNKRFPSYDSVLFELIADSSISRAQIGQPADNPLSLAQKTLQSILGFTFQLEQINYNAKNFVHADMSPEQFSESMQKRGESVSQLLLKVMLSSMANEQGRSPPNLSDLIMLGFSQHRTTGFRRSFARQFQDMESMIAAINGDDGSTIISERNKVAVSVSKSQLALGNDL